jgi:hypothetical protein
MLTPAKPSPRPFVRYLCIAAIGALAVLGLVLCFAPDSEAKPTIKWAAAQQLQRGSDRQFVVAGMVQAERIRVGSAAGCKRLELAGPAGEKRAFGVIARANGKHCADGPIERRRARIFACNDGHCFHREVRISRFRDSDGDGLADLYERWVLKTSPFEADSDGDGLPDGYEVRTGSDPNGTGNAPATPSPPVAPPPDLSCVPGSANATSETAVRSAVAANRDVCITAAIGDLDLESLGNRPEVVISTEGDGSIEFVDLGGGTTGLTIRGARLRSIELRGADRTLLLGNVIGGTPANRVLDQLIFMPEPSDDVTIQENDLGWTEADDSGNTGYGCRCYGNLNGLRFIGNRLHDLAGDGFQGVGGSDVLIDRNEIGPVGANPSSNEHADNIQIIDGGPNLRITNNWIHSQGYYGGQVVGNSGSLYIHGGGSDPVLVENNLISTNQGRTEVCGLGTGGTSRSNLTVRNNTWVDGGLAFTGFPGFEWDCDSGSGNAIERNIAVDPDGGFAQNGSAGAATIAGNLWGQPSLVSLDRAGNCVSANCNPPGQPPIGFRKPLGVGW